MTAAKRPAPSPHRPPMDWESGEAPVYTEARTQNTPDELKRAVLAVLKRHDLDAQTAQQTEQVLDALGLGGVAADMRAQRRAAS